MKKQRKQNVGQILVEYFLILAFISVVVILTVGPIVGEVSSRTTSTITTNSQTTTIKECPHKIVFFDDQGNQTKVIYTSGDVTKDNGFLNFTTEGGQSRSIPSQPNVQIDEIDNN